MINNVVLVGRLTKDPELKYSNSNVPMVSFTLAVNRVFADQNGNRNADFIRCVVFRKQAENMARYLAKGSLIGVTGRIQTGSYQGKDGNTVYTTDVMVDSVQFLESKSSSSRNADNGFSSMSFNQPPKNNFAQNNQFNAGMHDFMNDNDSFTDFGENFPNSLDDDFFNNGTADNPFRT